ncbi:hypothetical protein [Polluticoccus soli]|uniref:DUF7878 domain-containing protein n=1 Tax=Polluticoccus soli TaxID=3034150 RepID=UPI0023E2C4C2|nr:hypothetical protein [Flavipsychrobacter sp. JY13-12]
MNIEFEIIELPTEQHLKYAAAFVEGELRIYIGNNLFFSENEILLLELANTIDAWLQNLNSDPTVPLIYETMDYDVPILTFEYVEGNYLVDSPWKQTAETMLVTHADAVNALKSFSTSLRRQMRSL